MEPIRIFIGYDQREEIAYHVLCASIMRRASAPIQITPVALGHLRDVFSRERNALQSTEFSFSRFLTPYLCGFRGWAIFMDCDMLVLEDICEVWNKRDDSLAVMCVKHDHVPRETEKFLGQVQTRYERKNWSSFMLMNCDRCRALTPEYVNRASGLELHRFTWLADEEIGALPSRWNHLVDYDEAIDAKLISNLHFTRGGPYFQQYRDCGYADLWWSEFERLKLPLP
jgi:hypothetical protein